MSGSDDDDVELFGELHASLFYREARVGTKFSDFKSHALAGREGRDGRGVRPYMICSA